MRVKLLSERSTLRNCGAMQNKVLVITLSLLTCLALVLPADAQSRAGSPVHVPPPGYVDAGAIASSARPLLSAFGERIQRPGKERVTLMGKLTDASGTFDVSLVWEVPGRFRLDRSDKPGRPLICDEAGAWNNGPAILPREAETLESLFDDTSESFFYGMVQGTASRFLGNRFRADNGKTPNYQGPWFDVYEVFAVVRGPQGISKRRKVFLFDSQTALLSRVDYTRSEEHTSELQ